MKFCERDPDPDYGCELKSINQNAKYYIKVFMAYSPSRFAFAFDLDLMCKEVFVAPLTAEVTIYKIIIKVLSRKPSCGVKIVELLKNRKDSTLRLRTHKKGDSYPKRSLLSVGRSRIKKWGGRFSRFYSLDNAFIKSFKHKRKWLIPSLPVEDFCPKKWFKIKILTNKGDFIYFKAF